MLSLAPFCVCKPQALFCKCTPGIKLIYKLGSRLFLLSHRARIGLLLYGQGNGMAAHALSSKATGTCKQGNIQPQGLFPRPGGSQWSMVRLSGGGSDKFCLLFALATCFLICQSASSCPSIPKVILNCPS